MPIQVIENKKKKQSSWDETIRTMVYAILIAVVFRSFAFEPFHIPSGSMKNSLLVGDYLFVSKYSYGYSRYSFPFGLHIFDGRIGGSLPQRGDVVVFRPASQPRIDFIKRVIGLPGDKIQVKQGVLYINGEPLPRRQLDDYSDNENPYNIRPVPAFTETLPEGKVINILKERGSDYVNNTPVYEVPSGHYFMMGDNRDNSHDSRFPDIGFVPLENLVGRAEVIFYSAPKGNSFLRPIVWLESLRFDRFFKIID